MDQIQYKAGILTKLPKFNQSLLIDLPVLGVKTLKLIKKASDLDSAGAKLMNLPT